MINTQTIKDLKYRIQTETDCQSILFNIENAFNQQINQIESLNRLSEELTKLFLPLSKLPTSLQDIIDIFKNSFIKEALTQLQTAINAAMQIIQTAQALTELVSAINDAAERLPECFAQVPKVLENTLKQSIDSRINNIVGPALQKVKESADVINNAIPGIISIDTSSPEGFLESIRNNPINTPDQINQIVYEYEKVFNNSEQVLNRSEELLRGL